MAKEEDTKKKFEFMGVTRPSQALRAMVDGLRDIKEGQDVNMATFGQKAGNTCYGCAATFALQKLSGSRLPDKYFENTWSGKRAQMIVGDEFNEDEMEWDYRDDWAKFESAIDMARCGRLNELLQLFGVEVTIQLQRKIAPDDRHPLFLCSHGDKNPLITPWEKMDDHNWEKILPEVEEVISRLEREGL